MSRKKREEGTFLKPSIFSSQNLLRILQRFDKTYRKICQLFVINRENIGKDQNNSTLKILPSGWFCMLHRKLWFLVLLLRSFAQGKQLSLILMRFCIRLLSFRPSSVPRLDLTLTLLVPFFQF